MKEEEPWLFQMPNCLSCGMCSSFLLPQDKWVIDWDNKEVQELRDLLGEVVVEDLARACRERDENNGSGGYKVSIPWLVDSNTWEGWERVARDEQGRRVVPGTEASLAHCVAYLRDAMSALVQRAKKMKTEALGKDREIKKLMDAVGEMEKKILDLKKGRAKVQGGATAEGRKVGRGCRGSGSSRGNKL